MTTLASESFTGTNGAAWPSTFALGRNPTSGGGATIQSNTGRLQSGTVAGYAFGDRVARRVAGASVKDQDVTFRFMHDGTECYPELWIRSTNPELDGGTGYNVSFSLDGGQISLSRQVSFISTGLGSPINKTLSAGSWYRIRVQALGTALRVRVWDDGDAEPTTWNINLSDTTPALQVAGYTGISVGGGGDATAGNFFIDDFEQTDGAVTAPPPTVSTAFTGWGVPARITPTVAPSYTVSAPAPTTTVTGTTVAVSDVVTVTGGPVLFDTIQLELINTTGGVTTLGTRSDLSVTTTLTLSGTVTLAAGTWRARTAYTLDGTNWIYLTEGTFTVSTGTTPPPTGTGTWISGASGEAAADGSFGVARGRTIEIGGTWADTNVEAQTQGPAWALGPGSTWANWNKPIDIAVGGIYPGDTWAAAANRSYVARWDQCLNNLKSAWGARNPNLLYIRFAHEFSGNWSPWAVTGANAANFVAAWRIFHERKQLILPTAKLVWSPANNASTSLGLDMRNAWPGSAYVDVCAPDYYDSDPHLTTDDAWNQHLMTKDGFGAPVGLGAWLEQCRIWGVPMGLGEWSGHADISDNPTFFKNLYNWLKLNGGTGAGKFLYEVHFNVPSWPQFRLWPETDMPNSWTAYKSLWSSGVTPPTPPVDPPVTPPPTGTDIWGGRAHTYSMWKFRYSPAPNMRDWPADVKAKVTHVVLGLAQQTGSGGGYMQYQPDWGQSVADHAADIREFRSRGCNVVMGFGGGGGSISIQNETQVTQAMSSITGFVNTYSINGIDLDMEPSGSSWNQASIVSLFTQVKAKWGQNFICGITPGLYDPYTAQWFALVKALGPSRYDYFSPMEYDYPESQDSRLLGWWATKIGWMIDAGIPANKIIMGCMMQPFAGYSATINPQTILDAWNQEVAKRPTLRGIFEWEDKIAKQRNWDLVRKMIAAGKP